MTTESDTGDARIDALARDLIRVLAGVAGNAERVADVFEHLFDATSGAEGVHIALAALRITYAECMTGPTVIDPDAPGAVTIP